MAVPRPLRPILRVLGTPRGIRFDAACVRRLGHSPYSYLYGFGMGDRPWRRATPYRAPLALTTTGRRSGRPRTVALAYYEVDGAWAVVGSNGGSAAEPQWVRNLRADPTAQVHLYRRATPVVAAVLDGEAKRDVWDAITAKVPLFARFQEGVTRDIPIVVLRPA